MTDASVPNPENVLAHGDPGDETADRYRYQWTWAAVACCMLMDNTQDVEEVFCEHHEDILLRHRGGLFTGQQVKTRRDDQDLWKAKDKAVLSACARFAKLEFDFPGKFRDFCFLTNHPLYSAKNGQDLGYVLQSISDVETIAGLPTNVIPWVRRVAREAGVTEEVAFAAMSKTSATADLPKLHDITMRLISAIVHCWQPAAECSHESVTRAARGLIEECGRAASLDHLQLLPAYMVATTDRDDQIAARIEGKRMTLDRVMRVLEVYRDQAATLAGDPAFYIEPGEGSSELLHTKLDVGGFSAVSRESAEDLRDKADYLAIKWTKVHGSDKGLEQYNHICTLVLSDAGRAFDATQNEVDSFGPAMREELHRRIRERRGAGDQLFDCTDDHLEGFAFSLTAQCKIAWSRARPWESR